MPAGNLPRSGYDPELAALLSVDVDLGPLDRGLSQARSQTAQALGLIGRDVERFSRRSSFALQNVGFQVSDFVVQVAAGTSPIRAFTQQIGQATQAFAILGGTLGRVAVPASIVLTVLGALATAFFRSGEEAGKAAGDFESLEDALKELTTTGDQASRVALDIATRFAQASAEIQQALQAQAAVDVQRAEGRIAAPRAELTDILTEVDILFRARRAIGEFTDEQQVAITDLFENLANLRIGVRDFQTQLEDLTSGVGPRAAEQLLELGEQARVAAIRTLTAEQALARAQERQAKIEGLAARGVRIGAEEFGPPEAERGAGGRVGGPETDEAARRVGTLADRIRDLQASVEAARAGPFSDLGDQIRDVGEIAKILDLTPEEIAQQPLEVRELVQEYIELSRTLRELEEQNAATVDAEQARLSKLREEHDALAASFEERGPTPEERRADTRIETSSRLPDEIDAANVASRELSTTLTDINDLSFDSLLQSFGRIGEQILQMIVQALIFKAIMTGLRASSPQAGAVVAASEGLQSRHGRIFEHGQLTTAQHGAIFRRGQTALMTGAVSGAALLEGAGDEAAVPLTRTRSGDLGIRVEGGGGRSGDTYNLTAQRIDPGTVSWLLNQANRQVPNTVVNARARGQVRDKAPF